MAGKKSLATRVGRGGDGVYRWTYEISLFKNPTFFFLIWKIFFFIILGIFLVTFVVDVVEWGGFKREILFTTARFFGYFTVGMTALTAIGYLIYAAIMGGKYVVEFEMDEKGVLHRQIASQARKARGIGVATALVGAAAGKPSVIGAGLGAQRTEMYSDFSKVRKVKTYPRRGLIKVNGLLQHNQVWTMREDFDFVKEFILSHTK